MPRATPRDDSYPATFGLRLVTGSGDTDLTQQFAEAPYAAAEVIVTNSNASAQALVVRLQGAPSVDVTFTIAGGTTMWIRGAFVSFRASSGADVAATFLWQGGPS